MIRLKKKLIYTTLLLTLFTFATACNSGSKTDKTAKTEPTEAVTVEPEPTTEPLPTAETTITEDENGNSICQNTSDGYTVSYDKESFELTNESHTISIHVPNTNKEASASEDGTEEGSSAYNEDGTSADNSYMNVFCTITTSTDVSAKDYRKALQTAYKKKCKKKAVKIGADKTKAVQFTISEGNGMRHEMYVVDGKDKVYVIELKCPKSQKKAYNSKLNAVLESLTFA